MTDQPTNDADFLRHLGDQPMLKVFCGQDGVRLFAEIEQWEKVNRGKVTVADVIYHTIDGKLMVGVYYREVGSSVRSRRND